MFDHPIHDVKVGGGFLKEIGPGAAIKLHADAIEEYLESLRARDFPEGVA